MRQVSWLGQIAPLQFYVQEGNRLKPIGRAKAMAEAEARRNIEQAVKGGGSVPMGYSAERGRVLNWYFFDGNYWTEGKPGQQAPSQHRMQLPRIRSYVLRNNQWTPLGPAREMSEAEARRNIEQAGTAPLLYSSETNMQSYGIQEPVVSWSYYNGSTWYRYKGNRWVRESSVSWLGGNVGVIPANCWDMPGFKGCHAEMWEKSRGICDPAFGGSPDFMGYGTVSTCIDAFTKDFAESECVPQFCGSATRPPSGMTYGESVFNPATAADQRQINAVLTERGFQTITVDGKLGPRTCGAASVVADVVGIVSECFGHEADWKIPPCISGRQFDPDTKTCSTGAKIPTQPGPCPAGQQRDLTTGTCRLISCPDGKQLDPATGQCITPQRTSGRRKKKDNTGILLLGVAALAAGVFTLI